MKLPEDLQALVWTFSERRYLLAFGHEDAGVRVEMSSVEIHPEVARQFTLTCHRMGWNIGKALAGPIIERMQATIAEAEAERPGVSVRKNRGNSDRRRVKRAKLQAAGVDPDPGFPGGEPPEPLGPVCRFAADCPNDEYSIGFMNWPDGPMGNGEYELGFCALDQERFAAFVAGARRRGVEPGELMAQILNAGIEAVLRRDEWVQQQREASHRQAAQILDRAPVSCAVEDQAAQLLRDAAGRHQCEPESLASMILEDVLRGNPDFAEEAAAVLTTRATAGPVTAREIEEADKEARAAVH